MPTRLRFSRSGRSMWLVRGGSDELADITHLPFLYEMYSFMFCLAPFITAQRPREFKKKQRRYSNDSDRPHRRGMKWSFVFARWRKCALPSKTRFRRPNGVCFPNGISVGSSVLHNTPVCPTRTHIPIRIRYDTIRYETLF